MATKDDQEALRLLVQHVSRAFYEPKFIVIMDQLARHPVLKDDDLAGRIGLQAKELNKIMAVLSTDRLVQVHRQNELKEGAQRSIGKQYYYIDYQHFCNVVKWRIAEMNRLIDSTIRNELDNKGYICPNCHATFSTLEAGDLMDITRGAFMCDQCTTSPGGPHEVVSNENAERVRGSQDRMERFNLQTQFIRDGLKRSEAMVLPAFDVAVWIKNNVSDADKQRAAQAAGGLKIAGSDAPRADDGIGVFMSVDKDEATQRRERAAEAEAKRAQNAMPVWHRQSTVSGELTAVGVAESARVQSNASILESLGNGKSNANILSGLGKVKAPVKREEAIVVDVKPVIDHSADYVDRYYASLEAASQSNTQNGNTPNDEGDFGSDFDIDEEERKPSIALLDAPPATLSHKRSREVEDGGYGERDKALRSETGTPVFSRSSSGFGFADFDTASPAPPSSNFDTELEDAGAVDGPMVYVGGEPMAFSAVTQEIADARMSTEEYTAWYELVLAQPV